MTFDVVLYPLFTGREALPLWDIAGNEQQHPLVPDYWYVTVPFMESMTHSLDFGRAHAWGIPTSIPLAITPVLTPLVHCILTDSLDQGYRIDWG